MGKANNKLKISVHSDLHTEFFGESLFYQDETFLSIKSEDLDYLFLAGDIGNLRSMSVFFEQLRNQIPVNSKTKIIYVLGNHEHYGLSYSESLRDYRELCLSKEYDIILLEDEVFVDDERKVLIYGGTLWSDFELANNSKQSQDWAGKNVSDYFYIQQMSFPVNKPITPEMTKNIFNQTMNNIQKWFTDPQYADYKKIAVTHFLPLKECIHPKHTDYIKGAYWASHRPDIVSLADVWIYGHSHDNINQDVDISGKKVKMISNQLGYLNENYLSNFKDLYNVSDKSLSLPNGYRIDHLVEI